MFVVKRVIGEGLNPPINGTREHARRDREGIRSIGESILFKPMYTLRWDMQESSRRNSRVMATTEAYFGAIPCSGIDHPQLLRLIC